MTNDRLAHLKKPYRMEDMSKKIRDIIDKPYNRKAEDGLPGSSCKQVSKEVE
jgi:hypothetical protein